MSSFESILNPIITWFDFFHVEKLKSQNFDLSFKIIFNIKILFERLKNYFSYCKDEISMMNVINRVPVKTYHTSLIIFQKITSYLVFWIIVN
jgi:hypothetical protein